MTTQLFLSATDPRPMYRQIIDQITARVMAGDWSPGQGLPSIRELAAASGVSVITVKRAYEELERAGLIVTRHGKGSVVADRPDQARGLLDPELDQSLAAVVQHGARLGLERAALHQRLDVALDEVSALGRAAAGDSSAAGEGHAPTNPAPTNPAPENPGSARPDPQPDGAAHPDAVSHHSAKGTSP